jgi:cytochrome c556
MTRKRLTLATGAVLALASAVPGLLKAQDQASIDVIATRQAGQDLVAGSFTGMLQAVKNKVPDVKPFAQPARAIAKWEPQFRTLFPPGSDHGDNTRALPAIWTNRAGFNKASADLETAATKLSEVARSGNQEGFATQLQVVAEACDACHKQFRAR